MRSANTAIVPLIKAKTLELLMQKNPEQIGMRDIAAVCGITATSIYHYYKDKDKLFQAISLDCLKSLNERIEKSIMQSESTADQIILSIRTFRDWCFENPRKALLVMQGIKSADDAEPELIEEYYVCNRTGEKLLQKAVEEGRAQSENPRLDVGVLVSGLWGCIEAVLLKKSDAEYWNDGTAYTDRYIDLWCKSIFLKD